MSVLQVNVRVSSICCCFDLQLMIKVFTYFSVCYSDCCHCKPTVPYLWN